MALLVEVTPLLPGQIVSMVQPHDHMVLVHVNVIQRDGETIHFSGIIESLGSKVTTFKTGDEVRGATREIFADYVCVDCGSIKLAAQ